MSKIKAKHRTTAPKPIISEEVKMEPSIEETQAVEQEEIQATPVAEESTETPEEATESPVAESTVTEETSAEVQEMPVAADPAPIQETPVATPVIEAPATPAEVSQVLQEPKSEEEQYLDELRVNGTKEQKRILAAIESFADFFKPRVELVPAKAAEQQHEFLQHLTSVLEKDYEVFRGCWNALLVYFSKYHGVNTAKNYTALSEYSTTRYLHAWTKGEDKCNAYRSLVTLLRSTRNFETRKHDIKTIKLDAVGKNVLSEKAIGNLKKFYGV